MKEQALARADGLHEVWRLVDRALVGAVEDDLERVRPDSRLGEHVLQAHAAPHGVAHRAHAPLHAGDVRLEQPAAVARALVDRGDLRRLELLLQLLQSELERTLDAVARDAERPVVRPDRLRNAGKVIAHEKRPVRRDRRAEVLDGGLEVGRAEGLLDQRQLPGQRVEGLLGERAVG